MVTLNEANDIVNQWEASIGETGQGGAALPPAVQEAMNLILNDYYSNQTPTTVSDSVTQQIPIIPAPTDFFANVPTGGGYGGSVWTQPISSGSSAFGTPTPTPKAGTIPVDLNNPNVAPPTDYWGAGYYPVWNANANMGLGAWEPNPTQPAKPVQTQNKVRTGQFNYDSKGNQSELVQIRDSTGNIIDSVWEPTGLTDITRAAPNALQQTGAGLSPEELAFRQKQWEQQYALQQQQFEQQKQTDLWQQQYQQGQIAQQKEAQLANLRANPASWLEYAALANQPAAVQPWMKPLMPQEYGMSNPTPTLTPSGNQNLSQQNPTVLWGGQSTTGGTKPLITPPSDIIPSVNPPPNQTLNQQNPVVTFGSTGGTSSPSRLSGNMPIDITPTTPSTPEQQLGAMNPVVIPTPYSIGSALPTDYSQLPQLLNPATQYLARMNPAAVQQYYGYEKARTGATPEATQWQLWNMAPPSGANKGLTYR